MLDTLITSKTRVKLLLKFFLNTKNTSYLRGLEEEFGESSNAIRVELNRFEEAGLLKAHAEGNKKIYTSNPAHPLFENIRLMLFKVTGIDEVVDHVIGKLGNVEQVVLIGSLSKGIDNQVIDLVIAGDIDKIYMTNLIDKAEKITKRKIKYVLFSSTKEDNYEALTKNGLIIWQS
jgi:hypothetical protein